MNALRRSIAIAIAVPGKVELVQGATESLSITADDNVLPLIGASDVDARSLATPSLTVDIAGSGSVRRIGAAPG